MIVIVLLLSVILVCVFHDEFARVKKRIVPESGKRFVHGLVCGLFCSGVVDRIELVKFHHYNY